MWFFILPALAMITGIAPDSGKKKGILVVHIEGIRESKGAISIALYNDPANFPQDDGAYLGEVLRVKTAGGAQWVVEDLAYGRYALAIYHDINDNGKLDKNLLGIPTEPYAFAVKEPTKWRDPTFEEVAFSIEKPRMEFTLSLAYWKER